MFSSKRQKINEKEAEVGKYKEMESFALALPTSTKTDKNFKFRNGKIEISIIFLDVRKEFHSVKKSKQTLLGLVYMCVLARVHVHFGSTLNADILSQR